MVLGRSQRLSVFLKICNWKKIREKKKGEIGMGFFWWGLGVCDWFLVCFFLSNYYKLNLSLLTGR